MKEEAYKDYIENAKRHIKDIKNNKFFSAALKCRCESCSKKPLWASYPGYSLYTIAVFLGIFGALGIALFCIFKESPLWYLVGGIIGLLPIIALIVYNIITKNRIKSMPKEFLPEIEMHEIFEALVSEDEESSKTNVNRNQQAAEWTCPACGRVNQSYVGTCGCGVTKTEAQKSNKG